jgi:hypothetical protein
MAQKGNESKKSCQNFKLIESSKANTKQRQWFCDLMLKRCKITGLLISLRKKEKVFFVFLWLRITLTF